MNLAVPLIFAGLVGAAPPLAVVRAPSAQVELDGAPARAGRTFGAGARLRTGAEGWVEVELLGVGRARLSAGSELRLGGERSRPRLELSAGRAWVLRDGAHRDAALVVAAGGLTVELGPRTSAVIEQARQGETSVVLASGAATLVAAGGSALSLAPGQTARTRGSSAALEPARMGGGGVLALVALEAERARGELIGLERFLLERLERAEPSLRGPPGVSALVRGGPELSGAVTPPGGALVEDALRPPPFFEGEVPARGPNLRVEVEFDER